MKQSCPKCGGDMQEGFTTAAGLIGGDKVESQVAQILFVLLGSPTSLNPIKAFKQGRSQDEHQLACGIYGLRCSVCGYLELYGK